MSSLSHLAMGEGAEFDAIRSLLAVWGTAATGIGDDAAVLDIPAGERLVVSTDATVENVHFRRPWLTAEEIGARAAAAALSDLAAMAATPRGLLLALALPESWRGELDALGRGVRDVAMACACPIVGGNITNAVELSLTITVLGSAVRPLTRSGARAGDVVYVTGVLGGPGAAVRALSAGLSATPADRARFIGPVPRLGEAKWLVERGARAGIDVSDGLVGDAGQLARASAVTLYLDAAVVPRVAGVSAAEACASGEEYELLVAGPPEIALEVAEFAKRFGIPLTPIGRVGVAGDDSVVVSGASVGVGGHDHLGRD